MNTRAPATLQRKCACGRHTAATECNECSKERPALQQRGILPGMLSMVRPFSDSRFDRDLSAIGVSSEAGMPTRQGVASRGDGAELAPPKSKTGDCVPGKSQSQCIEGVGYLTTIIDNDCCTRPCTVEHESIHVHDLDACCKAYHRTRAASGADKVKVDETWLKWMEVARPVSECRAYSNDLTCAEKLAVLKGCTPGRERRGSEVAATRTPAGAASEIAESSDATAQEGSSEAVGSGRIGELAGCCKDIAAYAEMFDPEARWWCSLAKGRSIPPCPFTGSSTKP